MFDDRELSAGRDQAIAIHGAREHNLKNVSLTVPRGRFVVVTGVSGSGKSTLAFDLLFAEGQRRFLDSMNVYARQFVEQLSRPDVDLITGIPPTVSIEQRTSRGGGKSTVATVTEVYHFIRLLFARLGTQFCPDCQVPVEAQTRDELGRRLRHELRQRGDLLLLAPVVRNRKGFHTDVAEWAASHGYAEVRADGKFYPTTERLRLDRFREHDVEIVVGVLDARQQGRRLGGRASSRAQTFREMGLAGTLALPPSWRRNRLLTKRLSWGRGRCSPWITTGTPRSIPRNGLARSAGGRSRRSIRRTSATTRRRAGARAAADLVSYSICLTWTAARARKTSRSPGKLAGRGAGDLSGLPGARLNPLARAVRLDIANRQSPSSKWKTAPTIEAFARCPSKRPAGFSARLDSKAARRHRARHSAGDSGAAEVPARGRLGYLQLGRGVPTLSGGEGQRIRLAAQLGSNLSGVLYILDEPTIGLHARDNEQLLAALEKLKARGNSVLVVEHDEATMRRADYIIDLGPGAGCARRRSGRHGHAGRIAAASGVGHRQMLAGASEVPDSREAEDGQSSPRAKAQGPKSED